MSTLSKSRKFPNSIFSNGVHYFPSDIKPSHKRAEKPYEVQGCYYSHKWYQDTFYISTAFKNELETFNK